MSGRGDSKEGQVSVRGVGLRSGVLDARTRVRLEEMGCDSFGSHHEKSSTSESPKAHLQWPFLSSTPKSPISKIEEQWRSSFW